MAVVDQDKVERHQDDQHMLDPVDLLLERQLEGLRHREQDGGHRAVQEMQHRLVEAVVPAEVIRRHRQEVDLNERRDVTRVEKEDQLLRRELVPDLDAECERQRDEQEQPQQAVVSAVAVVVALIVA